MDLLSLERKYAGELLSVGYKHIKVWLLIRTKFKIAGILSETGYHFNIRTRDKIVLLKNMFYGILYLFRLKKFSYFFFANTNKRYLIDGKYVDIYFDKIADLLGQDRSLFIEFAEKKHICRKKIYSKHAMSDLPFKMLGSLISKFIGKNQFENLNVLNEIVSRNKIQLNATNDLIHVIGQYYFYTYLFKIYQPKCIFIICYYSKMPLVLAANEKGIPVYEAQHGVINEKNEYYNSCFHNFQNYFPGYLLSYGEELLETYKPEFIFEKNKIIPIGSYYLNYIKDEFSDDYLEKLKTRNEKIVCVTSQGIFFETLMEFIKVLSIKNPGYLFILRLKRDENPENYLSENIVLLNDYDIYKILKYSDFNITVYSMVALEADFLDVHNILFNINGLSKKYYSSDLNYTIIEPDQMNLFEFPSTIKKDNKIIEKYHKSDYQKNIIEFCMNLR